jgi:hypothetical protein
MLHEDIVEFFHFNKVAINTLVEIEHINGNIIIAKIAKPQVYYNLDKNGAYIDSCILIVGPEYNIDYKLDSNIINLPTAELKSIKIKLR